MNRGAAAPRRPAATDLSFCVGCCTHLRTRRSAFIGTSLPAARTTIRRPRPRAATLPSTAVLPRDATFAVTGDRQPPHRENKTTDIDVHFLDYRPAIPPILDLRVAVGDPALPADIPTPGEDEFVLLLPGVPAGDGGEFVLALPGEPGAHGLPSVAREGGPTRTPRVGVATLYERLGGAAKMVQRAGGSAARGLSKSALVQGIRLPTGPEAALLASEATMVLALLVLLRAGVASTLKWIHARFSARSADAVPYEQSVFECLQRPLESASIFFVATAAAEAVSRPLAADGLLRYVRVLRELGLIVCATWFLLRWIDRIRTRFASDKRTDNAQVDASARIAALGTSAVATLVALDAVGINVQTLIAFSGIGGVALGFAGKEIISNFFGGFMIYITRPFTVGEWVRSIEERELNGTVEDIGWYMTRVRTWDKRPLYIPNSRFSTLIVENGSRMSNRRILHMLSIRLEDIPVLPTVVADVTKMLMTHAELDPRQHRMAYVDSFGDFAAHVWLSCYTKSVFLYDYRRVQQEVLLNAHEIIRSHGARLAASTTRDVRPGADVDRYGPYGEQASFKTPTGEPKVGATPKPPSFKTSEIPGAASFSSLHAEDVLRNIESGVSEEALAAAFASEAPPSTPVEPTAPATPAPERSTLSTREAAVAAAAAALAAARRNAARILDSSETVAPGVGAEPVATPAAAEPPDPGSTPVSVPETTVPASGTPSTSTPTAKPAAPAVAVTTSATAPPAPGTMKITGIRAPKETTDQPDVSAAESEAASSATPQTAAPASPNTSGAAVPGSSSSSTAPSESLETVSQTPVATTTASATGGTTGTMKISGVRGVKAPEPGVDSPGVDSSDEPTTASTSPSPTSGATSTTVTSAGKNGAPVESRPTATPVEAVTASSGQIGTVPKATPPEPVTPASGQVGTMKISGVRASKAPVPQVSPILSVPESTTASAKASANGENDSSVSGALWSSEERPVIQTTNPAGDDMEGADKAQEKDAK